MKNHLACIGLGGLLLLNSVSAQEVSTPRPAPAKAATTPAAATPAVAPSAAYRAKTQSTFTLPAKGRNPFWPIGFVPRPKAEMNDTELLRIPVEQYKVTTIILGSPNIAVINGKDYTGGQFLDLATPTGSVKLLITNIEDGFVTVQYKSMVGKIPISRR